MSQTRVASRRAATAVTRRIRSTKQMRLVLPPRNRIAYEGWVGHSNMGDEAIFDVCRRAFPGHHLVCVPGGFGFEQAARLSRSPVIQAALLGGGTLVGRSGHRRALDSWMAAYPHLPAFALGVGVLEPEFERKIDGYDVYDGLRAWSELLQRFNVVTVRGPRSQEILATAGVDSTVVGDPGLLVDLKELPEVQERLLGINFGVSSRVGAVDWDLAEAEMCRVARVMVDRGWNVRMVPMRDTDVQHVRHIARTVGAGVEVVDEWHRLPSLLRAIAECEVFVGVKLHSVVFASAFGVPSLMLEYEPKCLEFQRSLGRERFSMPLFASDAGDIIERLDELADDRNRQSTLVRDAVASRREQLRSTIATTRAALAEQVAG